MAIPPEPFDKYTLIGKLGHGGMAEVNLAVAEGKGNFRKLVVIKRLHRHLAMEPGFVDMFLDEARLAARLNHPNVVQTHEVGEWKDSHFLAMEYLDGQGLERLLRMSGQRGELVPYDLGARIVSDALDGLAYAHELADFDGTPLNVVHRDVSPQNIFVTYDGVVKLLDFGIAKAATHVVETRTGVIKGKYAYIAPEQALAHELDQRADLWSMGVVLWEVLTGRRLFKSVNELATLHETLQGEVKLPSAFRPELPTELDTICMRALERDVDARYQSAHEMKEDLDRYLARIARPLRTKHIAKLMRDRFAEVIAVHKQTLSECLTGAGSLAMSPSHIERLVEHPMVTPTGVPSVTPTPTPSGAFQLPPPPPVPHVPQALPAAPSKGGWIWKAATVLLLALLVGLAAYSLPSGGDEPRAASTGGTLDDDAREPPRPRAEASAEPAVVQPSIAEGERPQDERLQNERPQDERLQDERPQNERAQDERAQDERAQDERPQSEPRETGARDRERRRQRRRERREREQVAPAEAPPAEAPGFLTLVTTPWTRVRLGSRDLGTTPLVRVELPAGTHTLRLTNAEQGIEETYRVTIEAGETVTRRLGLR